MRATYSDALAQPKRGAYIWSVYNTEAASASGYDEELWRLLAMRGRTPSEADVIKRFSSRAFRHAATAIVDAASERAHSTARGAPLPRGSHKRVTDAAALRRSEEAALLLHRSSRLLSQSVACGATETPIVGSRQSKTTETKESTCRETVC